MEIQFSAGGIVYKKEDGKIFVLVTQHARHHGWVFPKGKIGNHIKGETKQDAALREVKEETGVVGKILKALQPVHYSYQSERELIKKTVYYFLMEFIDGDINNHDAEMENVEWLPIAEVGTRLTYDSDRGLWRIAREYIETG